MVNPMKKKMSTKKKVLLIILSVVVLIVLGAGIYVARLTSNVKKVEASPEELGITDNTETEPEATEEKTEYGKFRPEERYLNIALLGVDTRDLDSYDYCRSDTMMVVSIDRENKSMKLLSVARDTYASIEDHGMDKITHAYAFGGPTLAVKTLNQNYDLNIKDFVVVNFAGMVKIIDRLGGVEITVDDEEAQCIPGIDSAGTYNLNGEQALAYSRDRATAGGDFKRTERQRTVLIKLAEKYRDVKLTDVMPIVSQLSTNLMTTLEPADITNLAAEVINNGYQKNIAQNMYPESTYASGQMIDGIYYYVGDLEQTKESMHNFLYNK